MISGQHLRLGYGRRIAICAVIGFAIRIIGFALVSNAESNNAINIVQYMLPLGLIIICMAVLFWPHIQERKHRRRATGPKAQMAAAA